MLVIGWAAEDTPKNDDDDDSGGDDDDGGGDDDSGGDDDDDDVDDAEDGLNLSRFPDASSSSCTMVSPAPTSSIDTTLKHEPGIRTYLPTCKTQSRLSFDLRERSLALRAAHGAVPLYVTRRRSGDSEHAARAGLAHERGVLKNVHVRCRTRDGPPHNGFCGFEFLGELG